MLMLATGLRRGEALGVRWEDVDLARGRVAIVQTVVVAFNAPLVSEPKTSTGRRVVRLSPSVCVALKRHGVRQKEERLHAGPAWTELGLVFTTPLGRDASSSQCASVVRSNGHARWGSPYLHP
jgi:integrase